jgi:ADP-ribose pyrophosphatase YjhB (NUDIX family)
MQDEPTWRVKSSRGVLKDRWINLRADDCVTAGGTAIGPYYVLEYGPWVNVVALTTGDELVLVRQYRHAAGAMVLELPGGMVDGGEDPAEAARRELLEESGYAGDALRPVSALYTNPASHTNRLHTFATKGARRVAPPAHEAGEDGMTVHTIPVDDVLARLGAGILGQAMQVSGLLLGLAVLGRISFAPPAAPPPPPDPPGD